MMKHLNAHILSILPCLKGTHDELIGLQQVDVGTPTRECVSVESRQEAVRNSLDELISFHVGLVKGFTASVKQLSTSTSDLESTMLITTANASIANKDGSV